MTLRGVTLRNRIVVSPMWQYVGVRGMPTDWHLMHLGRFADGGAGLVFQEATAVERRGCGTVGDLGIWDDRFVEPLRRLARIMRDCGTVPGIQLAHAGRKSRTKRPMDGRGLLEYSPEIEDWDAWEPIGPSAVPLKEGLDPPGAMTKLDIQDLVTNHRTDEYSGSLPNRMRIVCEVTEAVRSAWPDHLPLFVRVSCVDGAGWELPDTLELVRALRGLGVDVVDCSSGGLVGSPLKNGQAPTYGYQVDFARTVREEAGMPTMAVGLLVHATHAQKIIEDGSLTWSPWAARSFTTRTGRSTPRCASASPIRTPAPR